MSAQKLKRRIGNKAAREEYDPIQSHFKDVNWPLSIVQIDHTKVDIILVDDVERMPVGRP